MPFVAVASAVLGVGTLAFLVLLFRGAFSAVSDLSQFMAGAQLLAKGEGAQVYVISKLFATELLLFPYPARGGVGLFVPPCGLPWLMPLALLPASIAPDVWKLFLIVCLALSIFVLRKAFQLNFTATCWLTAFICFSGSTYEALRIDQISTPMFLAYCCAIWALKAKRPYLAAVALSVFLLKPQQIVPFLVLLIGARQYKTVLGFAGIAAALTAIAFALMGVEGFHNYSSLLSSCIEDNRYMVPIISCTLRGQLYRIFSTHHDVINTLSLVVCCASYIWYFAIARRLSQSKHWLDYGLVVIMPMGVALSPYCLSYDLLPLVPSLLILMTQFESTLPPLAILLGMLLTMTFIIPFSIFIHQDWVLSSQVFNPQFAAIFIFGIACMALYYNDLRKRVAAEGEVA
jgi:hypothetical protein